MLMAVVDTVPFLFMAFSASGVPPTMTVILMHASTIFVVLGSSVLFPSRKYTRVHHLGVGLIGLAICLCLLKATFFAGDLVSLGGYGGKGSGGYIEGSGGGWGTGGSAALSCWVFVAAACAHGLATLYKEKRIIEWGQPLDNFSLTSWLFLYQFLTTIIFSMVFYLVSGYGSMDALFHNLYMGWCCFLGLQDTVLGPGREDTDDALLCYESLWVIVGKWVIVGYKWIKSGFWWV
ncbi:hypothetical protein B484DRAFT_161126 [Ochromonadaceae sp. CCMP2298]|nr:hypothetical protein B484DRAFT_161126 [Ochromonadaceae sp. CCMP2298]